MPKRTIALATLLVSVAIRPSAFADSRFTTEADTKARIEQALFNSVGQTAPKSVKPSVNGTVSVTNSTMDVGASAANAVNISAQQAMQATQLNQGKIASLEQKLAASSTGGNVTSKSIKKELYFWIDESGTDDDRWIHKIAMILQIYVDGRKTSCSGQLIPDSILRFSSAATGEMPPLNT